jgi:hypothetical protein
LGEEIRLEKIKQENLKLQLEVGRAQAELKAQQTPSPAKQPATSPNLSSFLQATPSFPSLPTSQIPTLAELREKEKPKKTGALLPNNFVFSNKGTLEYNQLDMSEFVCGFLEMIDSQSANQQAALITHLKLLMQKATTYTWISVRNFHLAINNAVEQDRLKWADIASICNRSHSFFTHMDLRIPTHNPTTSRYTVQPSQYTVQPSQYQSKLTKQGSSKDNLCKDWNYYQKCSCAVTDAKYKETHKCRVCDGDHPMLHCAKRRWPIPQGSSGSTTTPNYHS